MSVLVDKRLATKAPVAASSAVEDLKNAWKVWSMGGLLDAMMLRNSETTSYLVR